MVVVLMISLVGAGFVGRGLLDTDTESSPDLIERQVPSSGEEAPSTPLLTGTDEEPVRAVALALGPSVVVVRAPRSLGSGVIYDRAGLIITNAHVVGSARTVTVTLNDGRNLPGEVVGADEASDVAVVRVAPTVELPAARLADGPPEVGDLVIALGSPFGLDQTITSGVVSSVNRPLENGAGGIDNFIQTDAPINPGNSGGALANRRAQVVGINTKIFSESGTNAGIGFAIPIDRARSIADRLVASQPIERAALGVDGRLTDDGAPGAKVVGVVPGSPAQQAGVTPGDVIVGIGGLVVKDPTDLAGAVAAHQPGEQVGVSVRRGADIVELRATLGVSRPTTLDPNARGRTPR
jgi:S1-C subfamily serine protease